MSAFARGTAYLLIGVAVVVEGASIVAFAATGAAAFSGWSAAVAVPFTVGSLVLAYLIGRGWAWLLGVKVVDR